MQDDEEGARRSWAPSAVQVAAMYIADGQHASSEMGIQHLRSSPGLQSSLSYSAISAPQDRSGDGDRGVLLSAASLPTLPHGGLPHQPVFAAADGKQMLLQRPGQSLSPLTAAIAVGHEGRYTRKEGQAILDCFQNPQV
jgi:hypothetical protein